MRIIAGRFRGHALAPVGKGDERAHLRPTTDRVREALFSAIESGRFGLSLAGSTVLDLFAGTGALGLEALSRGAGKVRLVEKGRRGRALIRRNLERLGLADDPSVELLRFDATRLPAPAPAAHDLVLLDPPYGLGLGAVALRAAAQGGWIAPGALVMWEEAGPMSPPPGFAPLDQRRYGDTWITWLRHEGMGDE